MQNQLKVGSLIFVGTKAGLSYDVQFFSYARAMEWTVLRWPYYCRTNQEWLWHNTLFTIAKQNTYVYTSL